MPIPSELVREQLLFPDHEIVRHLHGFAIHMVNGLAFSILYVLVFEARHLANWWFGTLLGLHMLFSCLPWG